MNNIVLVDTSYIFHRVTACEVWCKKSRNDFNHDSIYNNFESSIQKLSKKLDVPVENMILCRDDRLENLWRTKLYPSYKSHRSYSGYGPYIKELYGRIEGLFNVSLRIDEAEGDDIIAILSHFYLHLNKKNHIYIISNDKDFYQLPKLFNTKRIHILDNSKFKEADTSDFNLEEKIISGDKSDNIKRATTDEEIMRNRMLVDLSYVPRFIQDRIFSTGYFPLNPNVKPLPIQLGFACINTELRKEHIFCSRTCRLDTIKQKGLEHVKELVKKNVNDLAEHVQWNYENGIRFMRISSELMPHITNPRFPSKGKPGHEMYSLGFVRKKLKKIGRMARLYKQRLTFHPGQFNILSTPREEVFQHTKDELHWHANILDMMEMGPDSVMVIHGGGLYGDKESAIERFITNFKRLPENVQRRLVIENCEKCYNIEDVLRLSDETGAPVIFDTHHYNCYNTCKGQGCLKCPEYYIPYILETWKRRGIKPKFHISEQRFDSRLGAHSDYVERIPEYLLEIPEKYGVEIDIMIEAKQKEQSVFHLYKRYPELSPF